MQYYLDTNILVFLLSDDYDNLARDVLEIINDPYNILYTSSIAVRELLLLHKEGKLKLKSYKDILLRIDFLNIDIKAFNKYHLVSYAELSPADGHKDPNDHCIIAQAISDKIPLISSDKKFKEYISQGLNFIQNRSYVHKNSKLHFLYRTNVVF